MAAFAKNLFRWTSKQLGGGGSSEAPPPPAPVTPPPAPDTPAMNDVATRRRRRLGLTAPARSGTQRTGASGLATSAPTERSTLLGG